MIFSSSTVHFEKSSKYSGKHGGFWNQNVHSVLSVHVYFKNVSYFC